MNNFFFRIIVLVFAFCNMPQALLWAQKGIIIDDSLNCNQELRKTLLQKDFSIESPADTLPKKTILQPKNISPDSTEDSDFTIKKPKYTIQFAPKKDEKGRPLIESRFNSRKAWLYSAVVPGLGQYYNHSYLKIPIIYGLFVSAVLYISFNYDQYQIALKAYKTRLVNNTSTNIDPIQYSYLYIPDITQLNSSYVQYYRKNLDLGVLAAVGVWALNAIDAFVVSELKGFDVSNDLSIKIRPALLPNPNSGYSNSLVNSENSGGIVPGIRLTFNFR